MNIVELLDLILAFVARWAGTTAPRIFVAFLGILCFLLTTVGLWERRIKAMVGALLLLAGFLMVAIALNPGVLYFFAKLDSLVRIRIAMVLLSFIVMAITIEAIRRSHLEERYAILWVTTSLIILVAAFFPQVLNFVRVVIGTDYVASVVGIIFTFLLLIAFHFSISLSTYRKNQTKIAQRYSILEEQIRSLEERLENRDTTKLSKKSSLKSVSIINEDAKKSTEIETSHEEIHRIRGTQVATPILIVGFILSTLFIGLLTPNPMVGDEVTHFFMLTKQADDLSFPNFYAEIPTGWGNNEVRRYPHSFVWHYLGAILYKISGGRFFIVQIYQTIFWLQFLFVAYLLARNRKGIENRSALLYVVALASMPVALIFSVTFYQDVPMTAQVLTSFYFLRQRRWLWSTFFLCFAIALKITALLFLPVFFVLLFIWQIKWNNWFKGFIQFSTAAIIIISFSLVLGNAIERHSGAQFYPKIKLHQFVLLAKKNIFGMNEFSERGELSGSTGQSSVVPKINKRLVVTPYEAKIIANHPGDLRKIENFFIYGGAILWIVLLAGCASFFCTKFGMTCTLKEAGSSTWLFSVGLSYILLTAYFLRTAPDARFFLPGIPFVLLPFAEKTIKFPKPKLVIATISALAVLQSGYVLAKVYQLRSVTPEIREAISYLDKNKPSPEKVFMYPEGNYRLFPVRHEWYLNYQLREFWKADNDIRIHMLNRFGIGAIVIKKHLIAPVTEDIINLGVYPDYFARDIQKDPRFQEVFQNNGVIVYKVPARKN